MPIFLIVAAFRSLIVIRLFRLFADPNHVCNSRTYKAKNECPENHLVYGSGQNVERPAHHPQASIARAPHPNALEGILNRRFRTRLACLRQPRRALG